MAAERDPVEVMERVLPDVQERRNALKVLLDSCRYAESLAPNAWSVSLLENGFRLNVGPVETLACFGDALRVLVAAETKSPRLKKLDVYPTSYASVPDPQCAVVASLKDDASKIRDLHFGFIRSAAITSTGAARKGTPFAKHHSPALLSYAQALLKNADQSTKRPPAFARNGVEGELTPDEARTVIEGAKLSILVNRYERDASAREQCVSHWGCQCVVCGFDFAAKYGDLGDGFIHVHHLVPLSEIGEAYELDPIKDLRPVCPNCHAMLHRKQPPLTPEELQEEIQQAQ